jgi:polysaccharide biosynthesis transport protein
MNLDEIMHPENLLRPVGHEIREDGLQLVELRRPVTGEIDDLAWKQPTINDYWRPLRRRKWTIALVVAAAFSLAGIASLLETPLYDGTGRISVGRESIDLLGLKETGDNTGDIPEYNMFLDAQVRILQSNTLVLQVARDLHWLGNLDPSSLHENAAISLESKREASIIKMVQRRLHVTRVPRTGPIIEIQYADPDPRKAAGFVNALIHAYIDQNLQTKYETATQVSNWLTSKLQELKRKVESSQQELVDYQKQRGILGIDEKQNIVTAKLDDLNKELTVAQTDRIQKQAIYENSISNDPELLPGATDNPVIQHLKQQQTELESQYAQATAQMGTANPKVIELKNQLNQINTALGSELRRLARTSRTIYLIAIKREQVLRAALEAQKQQANQLNESAIQYNLLKHDLQSNQQLYGGLQEKLKEAGISAGLRASNVAVVDYARVPLRPSKPNIPFNLAVGLLIGCLGGCILALILEKVNDSLRTPSEVQSTTALKLFAVIPALTSVAASTSAGQPSLKLPGSTNGHKEEVELIAYTSPKSEFAECYRALRTSLLLSSTTAPKVILITSSLPYEGKTTTAVNCAIVLAQKGARVLLIDADLRGPRIHDVLGLPSHGPGLSTLLSGSEPLNPADVIVRSAHLPTLFVLPAGHVPDLPAELLDSNGMKRLLNQWRDQFDHIVIDTAPVLSATESVVLSLEADSVLLTVRSGVTPKDALLRARDLLLGVKAKVTGVVVNAVDLQDSSLEYYNYYRCAYQQTRQTEHRSAHE